MVMQPDLSALVNSSKLLACLVLHNFERDKAIGLGRPGKLTSDLAWHYYTTQQAVIKEAFSIGVTQQASKRVSELVTLARDSQELAEKQQYLDEALALQAVVRQVTNGRS